MKLNSMQDLLVAELQDLLSAERQIAQTFPKVLSAVSHAPLRQQLESHLQETREQEQRLERCFKQLGVTPQPARSHGMVGLISTWMEVQSAESHEDIKDAAIISCLQHIEHYEIAGYGCARAVAEELRQSEVAGLLAQTLQEEERFDRQLTDLAKTLINRDAAVHSL
jgi:ferritin-like metal-binding protein YciE